MLVIVLAAVVIVGIIAVDRLTRAAPPFQPPESPLPIRPPHAVGQVPPSGATLASTAIAASRHETYQAGAATADAGVHTVAFDTSVGNGGCESGSGAGSCDTGGSDSGGGGWDSGGGGGWS